MKMICKNCGYKSLPEKGSNGNFWIGLIFWIIGFCFTPFLFIAVPYTIWGVFGKKPICPKCDSSNLVSLDSPIGRSLAK